MKNLKRNYIAKGRQVGSFDIVAFTVSLEALQEIAHEFNGKMYVSFEIMKLKVADRFGKTHSLYQLIKEDEEPQMEQAEEPKTKSRTKKSKQHQDDEPLPF